MSEHDRTPLYTMSVAANLTGLHPQTLRAYDKAGLVCPARLAGGNRLYSNADVAKAREIAALAANGMPLEGIRIILELRGRLEDQARRLAEQEKIQRSTALVLYRRSSR